jgi:hypothetical protein
MKNSDTNPPQSVIGCAWMRALFPSNHHTQETCAMSDTVHMDLEVSPELFETLESLANTSGNTLSSVFRKAIALMVIANDAKVRGQTFGIINKRNKRLVREIVGI